MMPILILRAKVFLALTCKTNGHSRMELRYLPNYRCKFYTREKITERAILTIHLPLAQLGAFKFPLLISEDGEKLRKRHWYWFPVLLKLGSLKRWPKEYYQKIRLEF